MKLQSILTIAFAASAYASTIADVENDIKNMTTQVTTLDSEINSFPATGGSLTAALDIHTGAVNLGVVIDQTTSDLNGAPQPFSESDADTILTEIQAIVPAILDSLQEIVVKKPAFDGLPVSGIGALVKQDLINLNASSTNFQNAILSAVPSDLKAPVTSLKSTLGAAFSTAIAAYASETAA